MLLSAPSGFASMLSYRQMEQVAPIERRPPPQQQRNADLPGMPAPIRVSPSESMRPESIQRRQSANSVRGEHLAQWMNQHRNLTPQQQQNALEREPGFSSLPVPTQQRYRDRLTQLDAMNPEKRERFLARTEAMERLTPDQRADVRDVMGQLGSLPMDRRRVVAHTFRALRDLPAEQRISALNSGRFGPPLDDGQRAVLYNLLRVEPLLPPPAHPTPLPNTPALPPSLQEPR